MLCDSPILLVEDDPALRNAIALVLQVEGYPVAAVANGQEAVDYLRSHEAPCLILLDLLTPVMNGWQFRQKQRQDPALAGIPVVVLSGVATAEADAAALGATGFIHKPVEAAMLLATVRLFATPGPPEVLVIRGSGQAGDVVTTVLRGHGFTVHVAADAPGALGLLAQRPHGVRLALVDPQAPGVNDDTLGRLGNLVKCYVLSREGNGGGLPELPDLQEAARLLRELAPLA